MHGLVAYGLSLLAAVAAHLGVSLMVATYISLRSSDYGFRHVFVITVLGIVGLLIFYVPCFAIVGALLRWLRVRSLPLNVLAIAVPPLALNQLLFMQMGPGNNPWTLGLALPSAMAGALAFGWSSRTAT